MRTIGVIGLQLLENHSFASELKEYKQNSIKLFTEETEKVFVDLKRFPHTEVVQDISAIIDDCGIETVFVSKKKLHLASKALKAGKAVRVI